MISASGSKSSWGRRLAELLVVFVGVTAAFVLNEWGTARKESQHAREYVNGILSDLRADSAQLERLTDACSADTRAMLRFLMTPVQTTISDDSLRVYLVTMASSESFQPRTVTFDALTSSGELSILTDLAIRKSLVEHYEIYKGIRELDDIAARYWETNQIPYLMEHVDMLRMTFLEPGAWKTMRFKNMLTGHVSFLQQKEKLYRSSLASVVTLTAELQTYADKL